jgi:hypothetical protein
MIPAMPEIFKAHLTLRFGAWLVFADEGREQFSRGSSSPCVSEALRIL